MYHAYVIQNAKGILYKGSTGDIHKRLRQHNEGISNYTRNKGPSELVRLEKFKTRKEAEVREKFFKSGNGRKFLKEELRKHTSRGGAIGSSQGS